LLPVSTDSAGFSSATSSVFSAVLSASAAFSFSSLFSVSSLAGCIPSATILLFISSIAFFMADSADLSPGTGKDSLVLYLLIKYLLKDLLVKYNLYLSLYITQCSFSVENLLLS
jgi:hypothetical protein